MKVYLPKKAREFLVATLSRSRQYLDSEDHDERVEARRSVRAAEYLAGVRESDDGVVDLRADCFEHIMPIIIADYEDFHRGLALKAGGRK